MASDLCNSVAAINLVLCVKERFLVELNPADAKVSVPSFVL